LKKTFLWFLILLLFTVPSMVQAATLPGIEKTAVDLIGTPYLWGGTDPEKGFDCSGFVQYVMKQNDIDLPHSSKSMYDRGSSVAHDELEVGDLVFFAEKRKISHVGIYIGNNRFISATSSHGVKIDKLNDPYYWGKRYYGSKRV
jgi:cell wall-associated NlpC family hydrolase